MKALAGVVVADLTHALAGPFCTRHLLLEGAEVIKVERPEGGDDFRERRDARGRPSTFDALNAGKKSVVIDLEQEGGRRELLSLVRRADVADLVIGHVEVPFTVRGPGGRPNPNPGREPEKLEARARAGFEVATLAANHLYDAGREGVEDTLAALRRYGLRTAGAGLDLEEARRPAVAEAAGARVGVLSFNCVGPGESWATPGKAGCAHVEILTHYELDHATPGAPASRILTFPVPETQWAMEEDVTRVRAEVDVLLVALHKGLIHTPAKLAMYERPLARAAIDSGADLVVSHHAHILRGVDVYRGRPIFHGLGNFVTVTRVLNTEGNPNPEMLEWARRRREMFGFEPDPRLPTYPFHPQSRNTMVASCTFGPAGLGSAGFIPCWIEDDGRPRPLARPESEAVAAYVERIGREAGLEARFEWEGDRVMFWRCAG